jgi:hypothetical protein
MVCLRNISVDTLHKGDTKDNNNNNNKNIIISVLLLFAWGTSLINIVFHRLGEKFLSQESLREAEIDNSIPL